ncbi:MAG: DNA-processing protein DprA [Candidatus Magnetobacterium sp. LHC-1]|uniref:DNA-processing protein DprA n=1 Tax=Candidatus Magnetobacterium casense TaxID=1455061 RepID=A0ABS6S1R5_9BACT|nr:DNA-processing protein DprA [Candidatus Magnetobacterium casensis]MBF0609318.1 DNA-processing protein DprA [Nitrospirota bacterium]MBV6342363.1 DNA-processing protein DprA [Candidatus Magnetobacterium casensis]
MIYYSKGNMGLLNLHKVAFLCSRDCPERVVLRSYEWAIEQRQRGVCVISGFHSDIEKDVLYFLLKGNQPIIIALARGFMKDVEPQLRRQIDRNRLLIITPFEETVKRVTAETAGLRNRLMLELADEIVVAYASKGGKLDNLVSEIMASGKIVRMLG